MIELLVVVAIIGMLASIVMVSMGGARSKARDVKRQSDMRQIVTAQALVMGDDEKYKTNVAATGLMPNIASTINVYLLGVKDPTNSGTKIYTWVGNTGAGEDQKFCVYALLENPSSPVTYFTASDRGTFTSTVPPTLPACGY